MWLCVAMRDCRILCLTSSVTYSRDVKLVTLALLMISLAPRSYPTARDEWGYVPGMQQGMLRAGVGTQGLVLKPLFLWHARIQMLLTEAHGPSGKQKVLRPPAAQICLFPPP